LIKSGIADVAVVESHSKISDVLNPDEISSFALDPIYDHHVNADPRFVAGLEMTRYLKETSTKRDHCAQVAVKNKKNALLNPRGVHGANLDKDAVLNSKVASSPLTELESSKTIDGSIVFVLASAAKAKKLSKLAAKGKAGKMVESGAFDRDGRLPVNASGGSLGVGHLLEATGLHKMLEAVLQLRGQAGRLQIPRAKKAVVQSWRGIPTATGAVAVLGN